MILTIDIGNTNIVMGCFLKDQLLFLERFSTEQDSTALEYATIIREMLDLHEIKPFQIKGGIISFCHQYAEGSGREIHRCPHAGGWTRHQNRH